MADEELMSPETVGKYLAKSKAPKAQVTPVRKQEADFRVTPSLTGPATIKRKLGDNEGYPRGFNPQQMGEVHQAEEAGRMAIFSNSAMDNGRKHAEHEKSLVRENVARSRVNPMEIPKETKSAGQTPLEINVQPHRASGEYVDSTRSIYITPETHDKRPETLTHEMGHEAMHRDSNASQKAADIYKEAKQEGVDYVESSGGYMTSTGWAVSAQHKAKAKGLMRKAADVRSGYNEGYATKYAADNFVQDPRKTKKSGEWDPQATEETYPVYAAIAPHTRKGTRIQHFAKGYSAAGGIVAGANNPFLLREEAALKTKANPNDVKYGESTNTSGAYSWTGGDVLKAAAAARGATDAEIRGTAPRKRAAKKPKPSNPFGNWNF
jgi:hypothetical protein